MLNWRCLAMILLGIVAVIRMWAQYLQPPKIWTQANPLRNCSRLIVQAAIARLTA